MKPRDEFHPDELDPRLFELLGKLSQTPARDPQAVERGRMKFHDEMKSLGLAAPARSQAGFLSGWIERKLRKSQMNKNVGDDFLVNNRKQRFTFTSAVTLITLLVFLFGGAGMTALASQASLPGDVLYPVKTGLEHTRLALSGDSTMRAQLQMGFAERRLGEIAGLIEEGRFENIPSAIAKFESYIHNAFAELETIAQDNPEQAAILAGKVSEALSRYALALSGLVEQVPESVRLEMRRALQNAQEAGKTGELEITGAIERIGQEDWVVAGKKIMMNTATEMRGPFAIGDIVSVHAFQNADGSITAREIKQVRPSQGIENDNTNSNTNTHGNANENGDRHPNLNTNDNSNSNDDHSNANQVGNQNGDVIQNQNHNGEDDGPALNQDQNQDQNQNSDQNQQQVQNQNQSGYQGGDEIEDQNQLQSQEQNRNANENGND